MHFAMLDCVLTYGHKKTHN